MRRISECPACLSSATFIQSSFVSPWIRDFAGIEQRRSRYFVCSHCGSGHFDYRYSEDEMSRIYSSYRSRQYFEARNRWEPTYTKTLDYALSTDQEIISKRQGFILESLQLADVTTLTKFESVLDVGGDRGQFIPSIFPNRWVLDTSEKELISGVQRVKSLSEAKLLKPDLVLAMGVLEHLSEPAKLIRELSYFRSSNGSTYIYIEVPSGVPERRKKSTQLVSTLCGFLAARSPRLWSNLDLFADRGRKRKSRLSSLMPMRQSEHLNFFSISGLRQCLQENGLTICLSREVALPIELSGMNLKFASTLTLLAKTN